MQIVMKLSGCLPVLVLLLAAVSSSQAKYGGGSGTADDPYQIWTAEQMNTIGANKDDWGERFKLMADIDLSGFDGQWGRPAFNMIAPGSQNTFTGVFDGNGHTISQLTIRGGDYLGLFGQIKYPAEIKNLGLLDIDVTGSGYFVSCVGGLVGSNGTYLGSTKGGTITNCYGTGMVLGTGGQANFFGGLVGANYGEVSQCYYTGVVKGAWHVGGLVGGNGDFMFPQGVVRYCYSTGTVQSINQVVGGLVADNYGTVTCSYSNAAVSSDLQSAPWTGGLVAANHGTVTNCYSSGAVRGMGWYAGGLTCWSMGTVTNCFWDTQTSGQATSSGGTGKTTAEMRRASTFLAAGWDFVGETTNGTADIWWIDEGKGYPQLWWCKPAQGTYGGGSGTAEDPYQIRTADQMNAIGASPGDWSKHFKLAADIDMSAFDGKNGRPAFNFIAPVVGGLAAYYWATPFSGVFDGDGHTISHLTITGENYRALFGYLESSAVVRNLGLVDVNVAATGSYGYVGAVGGYSFGLVTQCYSTGVVRSPGLHVGGLVGYNRGKIVRCYSTAATTANSWVGGLAGENWNTVSACYSTGAVTATSSSSGFAGGLVGGNYGPVTQCYSAGPVTGVTGVGGLVGGGRSADNVSQSLWDTQTSGQVISAGGTGKTTVEMQTAKTFLDAGWDFVGETANGTEDIWWIDEGRDYPHLRRAVPQVKYGGGIGTGEDPYQIWTPDQMNTIGATPDDWSQHFKLMADVDLKGFSGTAFRMIGVHSSYGRPFSGVFDGNGKRILNFTYGVSTTIPLGIGLFAAVDEKASIKNLVLENVNVTGGTNGTIGSLVGACQGGSISNCHVKGGTVSGQWSIGGLVGSSNGQVVTCSSSASVNVGDSLGGGLIGNNESGGTVAQCCSTGPVSARSNAGGLAGANHGTISDCYSTAQASATKGWAGGLASANDGMILNCYSTGRVSAPGPVGGLVGSGGRATGCFWDTQTSGQATSPGGTGKTTAEMQTAKTFLDAGWDFVSETKNGTEDIWWILEGKDPPHLSWEAAGK